MDPNETLRQMRLNAKQIEVDKDAGVLRQHARDLAELVEALDEWLSKGGFLPDAWQQRQGDDEHTHVYQGQKLVHSHPHSGPHGYFEHPEDPAPTGLAPYPTDVRYERRPPE